MKRVFSFKWLFPVLKNKYFIASVVFLVWILIFDQNNVLDRFLLAKRIKKLRQQKEHYQKEISSNIEQMDELQSSNANLEKFAREQYLMKKENEDLFIIVEQD